MTRRQFLDKDSTLLRDILEDSIAIDRLKNVILRAVKQYYLIENHTCKETCKYFNIPHSQEMNRLFNTLFPKGMEHGGARRGAGQKSKSN